MPEHPPVPLPLVVHGRPTCEDTAVVRDRLRVLGVPFAETDVDGDSSAAVVVDAVTRGPRSTPTLVFGDGALLAVEPTVEELDELLRRAGHRFEPPRATQLHGSRIDRPVESRALPVVGRPGQVAPGRQPGAATPERDAASLSIGAFRDRLALAILLAHDPTCLACAGYARQLAARSSELAEAEGLAMFVLAGGDVDPDNGGHRPPDVAGAPDMARQAAVAWAARHVPDALVLADPAGAWKRIICAELGLDPAGVALVLLDRFGAPRVVSAAGGAGGLIGSSDVAGWLRFLALECPLVRR